MELNTVTERFNYLRKKHGKTYTDIANATPGKSVAAISKSINRGNVDLYVVHESCKAFGWNENWVLNGENSTEEYLSNSNGNKFKELQDGSFDMIVELIPFNAYASYLETLEDNNSVNEEFDSTVFNVDQYGKGNYKAFIVKGDSMNGGAINDTLDKAKVLGRELGRHHWKDGFRSAEYGWIIIAKQNIFHKDIIDFNSETGDITLHSRNNSPEYADFQINLNDVYQIFKVIKRLQ